MVTNVEFIEVLCRLLAVWLGIQFINGLCLYMIYFFIRDIAVMIKLKKKSSEIDNV